jgi:hypothetical protein
MDSTSSAFARRGLLGLLVAGLSVVLLLLISATAGARANGGRSNNHAGALRKSASASLVRCLASPEQTERSVTFAGEMTLIPGATRMSMRIELLERTPKGGGYHPVLAPGVGAWRTDATNVRTYKHLAQFTDLAAPASYRALVSFRWLGQHGRIVRREERRSPRCVQHAPASSESESPVISSPLE